MPSDGRGGASQLLDMRVSGTFTVVDDGVEDGAPVVSERRSETLQGQIAAEARASPLGRLTFRDCDRSRSAQHLHAFQERRPLDLIDHRNEVARREASEEAIRTRARYRTEDVVQ